MDISVNKKDISEQIKLNKTENTSTSVKPIDSKDSNVNRDVNIGLDLLVNTEKHAPVIKSPKLDVKVPEITIDNSNPMPSIVPDKILSPTKVWSDMNISNLDLSKKKDTVINSVKPNISNIEIDIEPPVMNVPRPRQDKTHEEPKPRVREPEPERTREPERAREPEIRVREPIKPSTIEPEPSTKEMYFKKIELLQKINKIKRMGYVVPELTTSDDFNTIKIEYEKIKKMRESENSIKFSRKMLTAIVTAMEFLNNKFDPFDLELNGWSESVNENIEDYDDVFEALAEKYKGSSNMAPELKLLLMLGGSGFMFHLSNSMFKKMQNPDMLGGMMNNLMGGAGPGGGSSQNTPVNPLSAMMGMMGGGDANEGEPRRKEMSGPSGVDDILQHLQMRQNRVPKEPSVGSRSRKNKTKGVSLNL